METKRTPQRLADLQTPALLLDQSRMNRNIERMAAQAAELGLPLRPHLKTPKSTQIAARLAQAGADGFCVSTLKEAEYVFASGFKDLFYCVPFAPNKAERAARLISKGCRLTLLTSSLDGAKACVKAFEPFASSTPASFAVEIDVDGYRSGITLNGDDLETAANRLAGGRATRFAGLMSYAGASYTMSKTDTAQLAVRHVSALSQAKARLKRIGVDCAMVSLGSTPAILSAAKIGELTEARCGIYIFGDLFQAGIGTCAVEDIAVSVLTSVISTQPQHNRLIVDAGALALSKDRSTQGRSFDVGYGRVCRLNGEPILDLTVMEVSQELGMIGSPSGAAIDFERFKTGSLLRVLPNHADMTVAAYDRYHCINADGEVEAVWPRVNHW